MAIELYSRFLLRVIRWAPTIFIILACLSPAAAQKPVAPSKRFNLSGVTLASPDQKGWHVAKSDKQELIFEFSRGGNTSRAFAKIGPSHASNSLEKFFKEFETLKTLEIENTENLKRDSLHFNRISFNEVSCVQYDSSVKNLAATAQTFEYYNIYGYACPHPTSKDRVVLLEFSTYSNTKGFSEDDIKLYRRFFDSAKFTKINN